MYATLNRRLGHLEQVRDRTLFARARQGVEKESLRVTGDGEIAQTPHPIALGSTLTHASITTDYSEALLEFITPPLGSPDEAVSMLCEIHRFTIANLGAERLWATSMPCVVHGDDGVPIAVYGSSNSGTLRHVYRRGLALRYGRVMQVISGVHFNFSLPEAFWTALHQLEAPQSSLRDYIDEGYLGLIRNVLRYGWLVLYLFGASPAVCRSFLGKDNERFSRFDDHTRYEPFATSLRMSDIGYSNRNPAGLDVSYDSLGEYIESLARAIETPYPPYERIGVVGADGYQQLNANILQIENEYYSTVRPKRPPARGEKPTIALRDQGVEYIELRSLDVDPYSPCGVDAQTLRFLETFLWFCAAHESPPMDSDERAKASQTLTDVAYRGRDPELKLACSDAKKGVRACADELLSEMERIASALDRGVGGSEFAAALAQCKRRVADPETTPSATMLREMRDNGQSFFEFGMARSEANHNALLASPLTEAATQHFRDLAARSIADQAALEASDDIDFETYLNQYLSQSALVAESVES